MNAPVDLPFEIVSDDDRLLMELSTMRDRLVLLAETVSIKLEANMNPGTAAALKGDDQKKAVHLFKSQARKIEADLRKLDALAANFRTHIH